MLQLEDLERDLAALRLEFVELAAQLAQARRLAQDPARASRFLTLRAAGRALGLGGTRIRQLIAVGSLRTVSFPNGARRVPRSELERIDALGLEVALPPTRAARIDGLQAGRPPKAANAR